MHECWTSQHDIQKPKIKIFCNELSQVISKFETLDKERLSMGCSSILVYK